jgi:hypothetical protein
MYDVDKKWWDIIKPPASQGPSMDGLGSPLMGYMQGGGLDRWLSNPRTPGSGGTPQPQAQPQPQAPAPQGNGLTMSNAGDIMKTGSGYHPTMGFVNVDPYAQATARKMGMGGMNDDALLAYLLQQQGKQPFYGDQAQGVSGVAGNGPDGTDGGIY